LGHLAVTSSSRDRAACRLWESKIGNRQFKWPNDPM
jgi:hypothetical protein